MEICENPIIYFFSRFICSSNYNIFLFLTIFFSFRQYLSLFQQYLSLSNRIFLFFNNILLFPTIFFWPLLKIGQKINLQNDWFDFGGLSYLVTGTASRSSSRKRWLRFNIFTFLSTGRRFVVLFARLISTHTHLWVMWRDQNIEISEELHVNHVDRGKYKKWMARSRLDDIICRLYANFFFKPTTSKIN